MSGRRSATAAVRGLLATGFLAAGFVACAGGPRGEEPGAEAPARSPVRPSAAGRQSEEAFESPIASRVAARYLLFLPEEYGADKARRWPLILFLHGAGERGEDLSLVKRHGPPKLVEGDPSFPFVVVSPQCPADETWSDEVLVALLDHVLAEVRVDPRRVYLTGLSMGGFGAWSLAQHAPERFAAVVPICGGGSFERALLYGDSPRGRALRKLPFRAIHGARDPVVPLAESQRMVDALRTLGCLVELSVDPEAGHDSWSKAYADPLLYAWLLAHSRSQ